VPLSPGSRIGPYEIAAKLGEGGMGEVYRAMDMNLGRQVAIKVLPEALASDSERLARFDREARTLAALNHPNVAQIYGVERVGRTMALVMELVEGSTLAERLALAQGAGIKGSGIRDQGSGIRDQGSGTRDQGSGIRDQGPGIRDQGSGIGDQGCRWTKRWPLRNRSPRRSKRRTSTGSFTAI
jgi:hypothetical protein